MFKALGDSQLRRAAVLVAVAAMAAGSLAGAVPAVTTSLSPAVNGAAASAPDPGPAVRNVQAVQPHFARPVDPTTPYQPTASAWPAGAVASLPLAAPTGGSLLGATGTAAGTSVWAQALADNGGYMGPVEATVEVLNHKTAEAAGVDGVVFTLTGQAVARSGSVRVGLDYAGFAQVFGGNYGSRLGLVQLPVCALSTPQVAACHTITPLDFTNDVAAHNVSAQVLLTPAARPHSASVPAGVGSDSAASADSLARPAAAPGAMLVLAALSDPGQEGGAAGSYAATSLKPSGSWVAGGSTGAFSYDYPISVPPGPSSLAPKVGLSYDSGSLDGQTATTWTQSSWVGDGWGTAQSFVEQSFVSCSDNPEGTASPVSTQDQCYNGPILTLSLSGSSASLVWDSGAGVWKAANDNGSVVSHVVNSGNGTGTYNTDYWQVTDRDGTVYQFGRNQLPGWSSGRATTNSVDSVPVYSAHAGDPCYNAAGFTSSVCTMAYRWNLDYVKDVHGNAMSFWYAQDSNFYGRDNGATDVSYVRDSHLDHIDYGFVDGNAFATAPDRVAFTVADRCVSGPCDPLNSSNAPNWPDVPFDLVCASGATCSSWSPSFFSTVRLASISTQQWSTTASAYVNVDTFTLAQTLPSTTDHTSPTLWLQSITHTGADTTAGGSTSPITLPPTTFTPVALANRVDSSTLPPLYRYRIANVTTETGSVISPTYGLITPCAAPVTLTPSTNTSSCYPVYWTPIGYSQPLLDWFNKYSVTNVTQTDPTGGAPVMSTSYVYSGGAGWHFDDNEVVQPKYRTYGQFRGFATVKTLAGDGVNDRQAASATTFYRGMSKNNNATVVNLTDSQGGAHEDVNQIAGRPLEQTAYLGDGGPVDHSSITSYWVSNATATRTRPGLADLTANWVAATETFARQALTDTGTTTWRYTETDNSYDTTTTDALFGTPTFTYTHTVPANAAFDRCAAYSYAPVNTAANLVGLIAEAETDSVACGGFVEGSPASTPTAVNSLTVPASVNRPTQVVSDTRTFYDDATFATTFPQPVAPSKGDVTMLRSAVDYTGGVFTWQTTKQTKYDSRGRFIDGYDGNGNHITTAYTANSVGLTTAVTTTNALGQATTTTVDPLRGLPLTVTDPNSIVVTQQYDALGRMTSVWLYSRPTTANANYKFAYQVSNTGVTAVTSQKISEANGYQTSTLIYDALLRSRQTQTDTPQSGRMVADTFYDTRGWVTSKNNGWWDPATTPNTTLVAPSAVNPPSSLPSQDAYIYDGLGRVVIDDSKQDNQVVSSTTNVYNGDASTTIPPTGGVTKTTRTDPLGRTTELDQYTAAPTLHTPGDPFTGVWYLTGGTAIATQYGYDGHGSQNTVTDASGNAWTSIYDLLGHVVAKTDPDAGNSSLTYDGAGNLIQSTDSRNKTISYAYDVLNRKTGLYDAPVNGQTTGNQLAAWIYDNSNHVANVTNPIGHLTAETAYWGGAAYTIQQKAFNVFGESLGQTVTIPAAEGLLAGSYVFQHIYTANTGLPLKDIYPNAGGLPGETLLYHYTGHSLDLLDGYGGLAGYLQTTTYDAWGRVTQPIIGTGSNSATVINTFDPHTGRLVDQLVKRSTATPINADRQHYTYDLAGNITIQASTRLDAATPTETQCYTYDGLDRLSTAWTATDNCAATPTPAGHATVGDSLGSQSAYWTTWSFDPLGQRTQQIQHAFTGGPATDTTTSYGYDGNAAGQPHTLTATSGGATGPTSYHYDTAGNTIARTTPAQGNQTLGWNDAGQLASIATPGTGTSTFKYDADGTLLIQADPGANTLYLPGEQITLNTPTNTLSGSRYYPLPGVGQAIRTGAGTNYQFEITDHHNTPVLYLDNTAQNPTWRQTTPYGQPRGATVPAPDNHGFLNKPQNSVTGLTEIGARNYDPDTGRFISDDARLQPADPQQLNGYTYGGANPNTHSDPTGNCYQDYTSGNYVGVGCGSENQSGPSPVLSEPNGTTALAFPNGEDTDKNFDANADQKPSGGYTAQHNAARDQAALAIKMQCPYCQVVTEFPIADASKKGTGNVGNADIVAYDPTTKTYYVWEVKHVGGVRGEAGAESKGPSELDGYIKAMQAQWEAVIPGVQVKKGWALPPGGEASRLHQPDPDNPNRTLVTNSSTNEGRDASFNGVIIYWTRNKDEQDKYKKGYNQEADQARAAAKANAEQESWPEKVWDWLQANGKWAPVGLPEPVVPEIPILVPV